MNWFWLAESYWPSSVDSTLDKVIFIGCIVASIVGIGMKIYLVLKAWKTNYIRTRHALKAGHVRREFARLNAQHDRGDHSFNTLLCLLLAYSEDGYTTEAAAIADELEAAYEREFGYLGDRKSEERDLTMLGHVDAWINQGEFIRAADYLGGHIHDFFQGWFALKMAAFAYYLGHDNARAAHLIHRFPEKLTWRHPARWQLTAKHRFMLAYLQHTLCGQDQRRTLRRQRAQLAKWEREQGRNAHNPYGARLRDILADIREVMQ